MYSKKAVPIFILLSTHYLTSDCVRCLMCSSYAGTVIRHYKKLSFSQDSLSVRLPCLTKIRRRQAGAELCQAQFKMGLAKPTVASPPPSQLC